MQNRKDVNLVKLSVVVDKNYFIVLYIIELPPCLSLR